MSRYTEDKKMMERTIGALMSMCKTYGYELNEQEQQRLKRMKFFELHERTREVLEKCNQVIRANQKMMERPDDA
jgi:hypothetical protein